MFTTRCVCMLVGFTFVQCCAALAAGDPTDTLTFSGKVVLADGSPAAGAIVERLGTNQYTITTTETDADGRFQSTARFENGVQLHLRTPDGREQAVYFLSAPAVRAASREVQQIKLQPATAQTVRVTADGQPVAGAEVIVSNAGYSVTGKSDAAGQVGLFIPAGASLRSVAAYHPSAGVGSQFFREGSLPKDVYEIALRPTATHEIRVVDDDNQPVPGVELSVNAATGDYDFIVLAPLSVAKVRTDEAGIAKVPWILRDDLRSVTPELWSDEWKVDRLDSDRVKEGITVQKLRRKRPVAGRLIAPEGTDLAGILIEGTGFGTGRRVDRPTARAAADGSFTLMVPADHSYLVSVLDDQWACEPWTGDLLVDKDPHKVQVELELFKATPLEIHVARGPDREAVAGAFVGVSTERQYPFTNDGGIRGTAVGRVSCWLRTDADGVARAGIGAESTRFV